MRKLIMAWVLGLCCTVLAVELETWPDGLQTWEAGTDATVEVVELQYDSGGAEGAPATKRALRLTVPNGTWRAAAKSTKASDAVRNNTTLEISVLVPPNVLPSAAGAFTGLDITIRGQSPKNQDKPFRLTKRMKLDPAVNEWREYHLAWKYTDEEAFSKASATLQVIINMQSSGTTPWSVYVTNMKLTK